MGSTLPYCHLLLPRTSLPSGTGSPAPSPGLLKHPPGSELQAALRNALKWLRAEGKAQATETDRGTRRCPPHSEETVEECGMLLQVNPDPGAPGALSTSLDGARCLWSSPAMGAATASLHPGLSASSRPCGFPPSADAQQPPGNAQDKRPGARGG